MNEIGLIKWDWIKYLRQTLPNRFSQASNLDYGIIYFHSKKYIRRNICTQKLIYFTPDTNIRVTKLISSSYLCSSLNCANEEGEWGRWHNYNRLEQKAHVMICQIMRNYSKRNILFQKFSKEKGRQSCSPKATHMHNHSIF